MNAVLEAEIFTGARYVRTPIMRGILLEFWMHDEQRAQVLQLIQLCTNDHLNG